ncbi:estrogen receptor beta-2-like isoform X1 [Sardina pilchardus]|uniref:estrogen receptor beta-2-like isoform X1 n=1 Tax=Sardina pilchardus TaxID=27697 RepID=UPI002E109BDC
MLCAGVVADEGPSSSSWSRLPGDGVMVRSDVHLCSVCHDSASGYHYGVWSCEGCKAFFKRSIQGHTDYICPATNQCTIDKSRRKSCQSCRLRRCYQVGMMKCGVRRERCGYRGARLRRLQVCEVRGQRLETSFPLPTLTHTHRLTHAHTLTPQQLVSCILEAEPPQIHLSERPQTPYTEASMMRSLTSLADKELVLMITWAKNIPGFMELSLCDQVHLLESSWLEVLMLGLMWRSVEHPGKLIFCPDLQLHRDEGYCVEGIVEIFDMLLAATSRFRELNLQKEEYVCLKAMILLNSSLCVRRPCWLCACRPVCESAMLALCVRRPCWLCVCRPVCEAAMLALCVRRPCWLCACRPVCGCCRAGGAAGGSGDGAAAAGRGDGRAGVGHRQDRPLRQTTVQPPRPAAHAALTHTPPQQQGYGAPLEHEEEERGAAVRPAAGDAGRQHTHTLTHTLTHTHTALTVTTAGGQESRVQLWSRV